ncbi:MAG TPA: precorrin-6y C5,15-methyltransferase (decarboxylating) subunit CbiE [Dissulfurispiraceae bacterium]|nr:precorrin-6y C5,15-methyltransferase (decarboxylating) subunit CbiE [Dissulfurispiraceae bacterium]
MPIINVIGIGYRPLDDLATEALLASDVVLASNRLMEVFPDYSEYPLVKDRLKIINNVDEVMSFIDEQIDSDPAVTIGLIASGDPLFHGIGKRTLDRFGPAIVQIMPDLSSVQLASSLTKESWDDALLISLHGGPDPAKRRKLPYSLHDVPYLLAQHAKIFILTDKENNPAVIAEMVASSSFSQSMAITMHVCEQLGYPTERIISGTPAELAGRNFREPNIVVIIRRAAATPSVSAAFSLQEDAILHSRGLITKDEVRAVALHKLSLPLSGVVWDIGAGSGSVSVEIARLAPGIKVYSIEKDVEQLVHIRSNRARFGAFNIEVIAGSAPEVLAALPAPVRIFIGGSSGCMAEILAHVSGVMPKGIVVINAAQIETLNAAIAGLKNNGFQVDACQVSIAKMKELGDGNFFGAQNPVFVIRGERSL